MRNSTFAAAVRLTLALTGTAPAHAVAIPPVPDGVAWGETDQKLGNSLAARASVMAQTINSGDAYDHVVLRHAALGGTGTIAFFQMDKTTGGLKPVQFQRPRHRCEPALAPRPRRSARCPQRATERDLRDAWRPGQWLSGSGGTGPAARRADGPRNFRDTTIEAFEGCLWWWITPTCGLTGKMLVQLAPSVDQKPACPIAAGS